jgi:hypothetical protein
MGIWLALIKAKDDAGWLIWMYMVDMVKVLSF